MNRLSAAKRALVAEVTEMPNTSTLRARLRVHAGRLDATRRRRATVPGHLPRLRAGALRAPGRVG